MTGNSLHNLAGDRHHGQLVDEQIPSTITRNSELDTALAGKAPNTVDFLVGTASAGLTSEIAVGTSPGGELAGTWAAPTVDATHSGSAHTDFIPKALADGAGDLLVASAADTFIRGGFLTGEDDPSANYTLTTSFADVTGCSVSVTTTRANQVALVWATFDFDVTTASAGVVQGRLDVDGSAQAGQVIGESVRLNRETKSGGPWIVTLATAASHTFKLQAQKSMAGIAGQVLAAHTRIRVLVLP